MILILGLLGFFMVYIIKYMIIGAMVFASQKPGFIKNKKKKIGIIK